MQRATLIVCLFLLLLIFGGCVSSTQQTNNGATKKKKGPNAPVSIGFSMDTLKEERWQRDKDLVEKRAKELGVQVNVQVANGSDSDQIKQAHTHQLVTAVPGQRLAGTVDRRDHPLRRLNPDGSRLTAMLASPPCSWER